MRISAEVIEAALIGTKTPDGRGLWKVVAITGNDLLPVPDLVAGRLFAAVIARAWRGRPLCPTDNTPLIFTSLSAAFVWGLRGLRCPTAQLHS